MLSSLRKSASMRGGPGLALVLGSAAALAGCDAQAGTKYYGQPLLKMHGSVELGDERPEGTLVPALAFINETAGELHFVGAEVTGTFPAEFTLEVFEPPPDDAFAEASEYFPDEPEVADGYITAVVEDHPDMLRLGVDQGGFGTCSPEECEFVSLWCTADGSECYEERMVCPASAEVGSEDCTLQATGDPALKQDPREKFAGFSENYRIIYLREPVTPDSYLARIIGAEDGLDAGYHLFEVFELGEQEIAARDACWAEASELAAERYNEAHDTAFTWDELNGSAACPVMDMVTCAPGEECDIPVSTCNEPAEMPDETEVGRLYELAKLDLGCYLLYGVERILDPTAAPVSVRIGAYEPPPGQPMMGSAGAAQAP